MDTLSKGSCHTPPKSTFPFALPMAFSGSPQFPWTLRQPSETGFIEKANPRLLHLILSKKMQFGVSVLGHNMKQVFP